MSEAIYFLLPDAAAPPERERDAWLAAAGAHLGADEVERLRRYLLPDKQFEFLMGRVLLRGALALHGTAAPLEAEPRGKLRAAGCPGGPFFNLSHSNGGFAVIVSSGREVGIDLERIRPYDPDLAGRTMHVEERAAFGSGEDFFLHWTAKEAFMKLKGAGLAIAPLRLRVDARRALVEDLETGESLPFAWERRGAYVASWIVAPRGRLLPP